MKRKMMTALATLMVEQGLNAPQLERELEKVGVSVTADYLRKLASGEKEIRRTSMEIRVGLKTIFRLNDEQWKKLFDVYIPVVEGESERNLSPAPGMVMVEAFVASGGNPITYSIPEVDYRKGMCVFFVEGDSMDTGSPNSIKSGYSASIPISRVS